MIDDPADQQVDGVAIIGMACRFPGARTVDAFWRTIRDGVESITFFTEEELLAAGVESDLVHNPLYVKAAPMLEDDIGLFDASFFGINQREAEVMDPQHRLFLECAWEALETAGYHVENYEGQIGIYASVGESGYLYNIYSNPGYAETVGSLMIGLGNSSDHISMRVAYKLNLKGPALTIQTTCSSSLVAVSYACQTLFNYQADMMLAGGVTVNAAPKNGYLYQEGSILSPDGHCRAFDEKAQGTIFGSGLGLVVLKRLEDALEDGDTIYAVIKGAAVNNDGAQRIGYSAPGIEGQVAVISEAQALAQVDPATITYIEAHGTATPMGDPIEVAALTSVFRAKTDATGYCALGSVKSNIGHMDKAAGIAGLIKTALMLKHKLLPPTLHVERPNPRIDFAHSPFYVNTTLSAWNVPEGQPRRAGVSSFGLGGTNAHVVLEEAPMPEESVYKQEGWHLLPLATRTPRALDVLSEHLQKTIQEWSNGALGDIAYTLQFGRKHFEHRRVLLVRERADAQPDLQWLSGRKVLATPCPVVFLFPGQGTQYVHMTEGLYRSLASFREAVDQCAAILQPVLGEDIRALLYPTEEKEAWASERLSQTAITQPVVFSVEYALAKLWMSCGIVPEMMLGHSIGEYVAATLAGVFSLEDALRLVTIRGRLMQRCQSGAMLSVSLSSSEVQPLLGEHLSLAAHNAPSLCVVAGPHEQIEALQQYCQQQKISCQQLHTSHAFHSALLDPVVSAFKEAVEQIRLSPPALPYISNVTGTWATTAEACSPAYWGQHLRATVRFHQGVRTLLQQSSRAFLEVGPGQTLCALLRQQTDLLEGHEIVATTPRAGRQPSDMETFLRGLARLWSVGAPVDWSVWHAGERRRRVPLPTYPFERQRYFVEAVPLTFVGNEVLVGSRAEAPVASRDAISTDTALPANYIAPGNEIELTVCRLWSELLGAQRVGSIDDFFELGGDSVIAIQCMERLRETYQVELPLRTLFEAPTVRGLAQTIADLLEEGLQSLPTEDGPLEIDKEILLDGSIRPSSSVSERREQFFLTGATGFLGAFLLAELLQKSTATLHCLVRAHSREEGMKRIRRKLDSFGLWQEPFARRIVPVIGDLAQPLLGLTREQFDELARCIDVIYHNGATVNFLYPYSLLKAPNVFGTQEMLRLACQEKSKPFHYISSTAVFELDDYVGVEILYEDRPPTYSGHYRAGYAESKWVAEQLVQACRERGLPVVIYRPGTVAGHSKTGVANTSDLLYRVIAGCIQLGAAPDTQLLTDITPVDYVIRAVVHLSARHESFGQIFHLVNPVPVYWNEVMEWCRALGYDLEQLSYRQWRRRLTELTQHSTRNALYPLLSLFPEEVDIDRFGEQRTPRAARVDCNKTLEHLRGSLIACPAVDAELLAIYLTYLVEIQLIATPHDQREQASRAKIR